jgi:uncharacterized protein
MGISMYAASVPVFKQMLGGLGTVLEKASVQVRERRLDEEDLLQTRLIEDMFPTVRQVQIACDFARSVSARLAGVEVPPYDDDEQSFEQLQQRVTAAIAFIDGLDPASFEGSEQREIVLRPGTSKERRLDGQSYLLAYGLPQFFFHVTTAYGLLRHSGIAVGKRDYMGEY